MAAGGTARVLYEPPTSQIVAGVLVLLGTYAAGRSVRLVTRGLRRATPLDLIRGIRVLVLALVAGLAALGVLSGRSGFVVLGALILAEELYETGVLALIIRHGDRSAGERA
jgi:hypothetical protein